MDGGGAMEGWRDLGGAGGGEEFNGCEKRIVVLLG